MSDHEDSLYQETFILSELNCDTPRNTLPVYTTKQLLQDLCTMDCMIGAWHIHWQDLCTKDCMIGAWHIHWQDLCTKDCMIGAWHIHWQDLCTKDCMIGAWHIHWQDLCTKDCMIGAWHIHWQDLCTKDCMIGAWHIHWQDLCTMDCMIGAWHIHWQDLCTMDCMIGAWHVHWHHCRILISKWFLEILLWCPGLQFQFNVWTVVDYLLHVLFIVGSVWHRCSKHTLADISKHIRNWFNQTVETATDRGKYTVDVIWYCCSDWVSIFM